MLLVSCCMSHNCNGGYMPLGGVLLSCVNLWGSVVGQQWQLHKAQHTLGRLQDCCAPPPMGRPGIQSRPTLLQASSEEGTRQVASHVEVPTGPHNISPHSLYTPCMHAAWPGVGGG